MWSNCKQKFTTTTQFHNNSKAIDAPKYTVFFAPCGTKSVERLRVHIRQNKTFTIIIYDSKVKLYLQPQPNLDLSFQITYIKRDEGFESDGESTTTTASSGSQVIRAGDNVDGGTTAGVDIKIIKDHVRAHVHPYLSCVVFFCKIGRKVLLLRMAKGWPHW